MLVALLSLYVLFVPRPVGPEGPPGADKVVHVVLFALLAASTRWRFGPASALLIGVLGYAAFSEAVQGLFLAERSGDLLDLVADTCGAALGWSLTGRVLSRRPEALPAQDAKTGRDGRAAPDPSTPGA